MLSIVLVIITEIVNTAIEHIANFLTTEYSGKIKRIKDLAAAAVLLSALIAVIVALIIFVPFIY